MAWAGSLRREVKREFQVAQAMARGRIEKVSQEREEVESTSSEAVGVSGRRRIVLLAKV